MAERMYANLNPFPITLPSPKGGQRTFAPNEIITGDWWDKLIGDRKLQEIDPSKYNVVGRRIVQDVSISARRNSTSMPIKEKSLPPVIVLAGMTKRPTPKPPTKSKIETLCDDVCESGCENSCEGACELDVQSITEEEHMRVIAGVYFCKYCDYNSPKEGDVDTHLGAVHDKGITKDMPKEILKEIIKEEKEEKEKKEEKKVESFQEENTSEVKEEEVKENDQGVAPDTSHIKEETDDFISYEDGTFECKHCGRSFKKKAGLVRHINSKHRK